MTGLSFYPALLFSIEKSAAGSASDCDSLFAKNCYNANMKKNYTPFIILSGFGIIIISFSILYPLYHNRSGNSIACTMEAKICPDGSAVGRSGPDCQFAQCPSSDIGTGDITLTIGQTSQVGNLSLTLNNVVQDSRCPSDVVCIQAGTVIANITLADTKGSQAKDVSLGAAPYVFDQTAVSIGSVSPARQSKTNIATDDYRITFHIASDTQNNTGAANVQEGYLTGRVTLSPICPVERIPPDPGCAPKPYAALVDISGMHNFYIQLHADTNGIFRTPLPVGNYTILIHQNSIYPRCDPQNVTLSSGATTTADISCDTGIR